MLHKGGVHGRAADDVTKFGREYNNWEGPCATGRGAGGGEGADGTRLGELDKLTSPPTVAVSFDRPVV